MTTIPTAEAARQAAIARRQTAQDEHDAQLLEQRSVLYGNVMLSAEELMESADVDDVPRLQAALDALNGTTPVAPATESLSDDEQELIDAFRNGRVIKTERGAYRDRQWGALERAPRSTPAPEPTTQVEPEPVSQPTPPAPEPEPVAPVVTPPEPEPAPEPTTQVEPEPVVTPTAPTWRDKAKGAAKRLLEPNPS